MKKQKKAGSHAPVPSLEVSTAPVRDEPIRKSRRSTRNNKLSLCHCLYIVLVTSLWIVWCIKMFVFHSSDILKICSISSLISMVSPCSAYFNISLVLPYSPADFRDDATAEELFPVAGTEFNNGSPLMLHNWQDHTLRHASSPDLGKKLSIESRGVLQKPLNWANVLSISQFASFIAVSLCILSHCYRVATLHVYKVRLHFVQIWSIVTCESTA